VHGARLLEPRRVGGALRLAAQLAAQLRELFDLEQAVAIL
jgi:hypothetical protein